MCKFINNPIIKGKIETYYVHKVSGFVANFVSACAEIMYNLFFINVGCFNLTPPTPYPPPPPIPINY